MCLMKIEKGYRKHQLPKWTKTFETGIRFKDIPKKCTYDVYSWTKHVRKIVTDLREEQWARWSNATVYIAVAPEIVAYTTLRNFWV